MSARPARDAWERSIGEPQIAHRAFGLWLEGKDLLEIAAAVGRHRNTIGHWRRRWRWDVRRDAAEAEHDARLARRLRERRRQTVSKHMDMLDATEALCAQALNQLNGQANLGTLTEVALSLQRIVTCKRAVLGMPTEIAVTREGPPIEAQELTDAVVAEACSEDILDDPDLVELAERVARRLELPAAGRVAADAGGRGHAPQRRTVEARRAPKPPQP